MKPRVAIIDDHTLFSTALGKLLEPECHVVGSYGSVRAFLAQVDQIDPDIVIVDVSMPSIGGLQAAGEIKRRVPRARLIFLSASEEPEVAAAAYDVGAFAFVLKRLAGGELQAAIRDAMHDRSSLTVDPAGGGQPAATRSLSDQVTPRQREVLKLLAEGRSMKEAAAILNVSVRTVAFHKYRMMRQLKLTSSAALIQFAVREGIV